MTSFAKRFGFGQKATEAGISDTTSSPDSGSNADIKEKEPAAASTGIDVAGRHMSEVEANSTLRQIKKKHRWDPNLPEELEEEIDESTAQHSVAGEARLVDELVENSPYPEVRAAVANVSRVIPRIEWT